MARDSSPGAGGGQFGGPATATPTRTAAGRRRVPWPAALLSILGLTGCPGTPLRLPNPAVPAEPARELAMQPDLRTQWWHYAGVLRDEDGRDWFVLVAFTRHEGRDRRAGWLPLGWVGPEPEQSAWFILGDLHAKDYHVEVRTNFPAATVASAAADQYLVTHGDWEAGGIPAAHHLRVASDFGRVTLALAAREAPVAHGRAGVVGPPGRAPCYWWSHPRLETVGEIEAGHGTRRVRGTMWFDRHYGELRWRGVSGWTWCSVTLDDGTDLAALELRFTSEGPGGTVRTERWRHASVMPRGGAPRSPPGEETVLRPRGGWLSPWSGVTWPEGWRLEVPREGLVLDLEPAMLRQEVTSGPVPVWAGAANARGRHGERPVAGTAVVEEGYIPPGGGEHLRVVSAGAPGRG